MAVRCVSSAGPGISPKVSASKGFALSQTSQAGDIADNRFGRVYQGKEFDEASEHHQCGVGSDRIAERIDKPKNRVTAECMRDAVQEQVGVGVA
jgi:hypothetical protein